MKRLAFGIVSAFGLVIASGQGLAAPCMVENQTVSLSGRITIEAVPARAEPRHDAYRYPLLHLDKPACYADGNFGTIPAARAVAIVWGTGNAPHFTSGQHVNVTGSLSHTTTGDQPPQALMLLLSPTG
ncbi:hypothetical protein ACMAUO_09985 [Gluconacetobacter sp. Hr-1-5]|uniref:hypothetical protein n=1 Tax=Gluconacetobacter sp. Hr-1-5 TaxID=3395370 RepID=UPI003B517C9E